MSAARINTGPTVSPHRHRTYYKDLGRSVTSEDSDHESDERGNAEEDEQGKPRLLSWRTIGGERPPHDSQRCDEARREDKDKFSKDTKGSACHSEVVSAEVV